MTRRHDSPRVLRAAKRQAEGMCHRYVLGKKIRSGRTQSTPAPDQLCFTVLYRALPCIAMCCHVPPCTAVLSVPADTAGWYSANNFTCQRGTEERWLAGFARRPLNGMARDRLVCQELLRGKLHFNYSLIYNLNKLFKI